MARQGNSAGRKETIEVDKKTIAIVGAGAIGTYLAAKLALSGQQVLLVGRPSFVESARREGLRLEQGCQTTEITPRAFWAFPSLEETKAREGTPDLFILAVKSYDTEAAMESIKAIYGNNRPLILVLQNGIGNEEKAQDVLPDASFLSGALTTPVHAVGPARVQAPRNKSGLALAGVLREPARALHDWQDVFSSAGIVTKCCPDWRGMKWSKLLLNILANGTCAILDMAPDEVYSLRPLFQLERRAILEALQVMRALKVRPVSLPGYPVPLLAAALEAGPEFIVRPFLSGKIAKARGGKPPSLQLDLTKGKGRTEVTWMNGAIESQGMSLGLSTPVNGTIARVLSEIASGKTPWDRFRKKPDALLAELDRPGNLNVTGLSDIMESESERGGRPCEHHPEISDQSGAVGEDDRRNEPSC
ncbi:MAG: ketopantoate reductase family protein [Armatimonadetes bacterium]|nr:ketopantoate reductase family protein [Armatimonadota bacterium]